MDFDLSDISVAWSQKGAAIGRELAGDPAAASGVAVVGPRSGQERAAFAVALDAPGVTIEPVKTAALAGLVCGHVTFNSAACTSIGATLPVMIRLRILIAAAGLGIGRRALREALT